MQPRVILPTPTDGSSRMGDGLITRMRAWFAAMARRSRLSHGSNDEACYRFASAHEQTFFAASATGMQGRASVKMKRNAGDEGGALVSFPRNGRTRLMLLAHDLRRRFADLGLKEGEPFLIEVSTHPASRLWIDRASCVEFRGDQLGYRVVLADAFDTRITFETSDFDTVVELVDHYIIARLADSRDTGVDQ